jgi:hypothetical protein
MKSSGHDKTEKIKGIVVGYRSDVEEGATIDVLCAIIDCLVERAICSSIDKASLAVPGVLLGSTYLKTSWHLTCL